MHECIIIPLQVTWLIMNGDLGMRSAKMMEKRHGLDLPKSLLNFTAPLRTKKYVGTDLVSRLFLVSIIFAVLPFLPPWFVLVLRLYILKANLRHKCIYTKNALPVHNYTSIKCRDGRSIKMLKTRHGLESNPVPTSFFDFIARHCSLGTKKDVGTGLDSRPCLVSIIFADIPYLHPSSFHEMIFILVPPIFSSLSMSRGASGP